MDMDMDMDIVDMTWTSWTWTSKGWDQRDRVLTAYCHFFKYDTKQPNFPSCGNLPIWLANKRHLKWTSLSPCSFRKDPQPGQLLYHPNVVLLCWRRTKRLKDILPKKINVACKGDTTPIPRWIDVNINKVKRCQTFQLKIPCTRISAKVALGQFTFFFFFFYKKMHQNIQNYHNPQ